MSFFVLTFLVLVPVIFGELHDLEFNHFPLKDCHTGQFDILVLSKAYIGKDDVFLNLSIMQKLINIWTHGEIGHSRVTVSTVCDVSDQKHVTCDLRLGNTNICKRFDFLSSINFNSNNVHVIIKYNIKIATTIFSDLGVGRQNSSHIAIIIVKRVNITNLTENDILKITDVVQEERSKVLFFVVVYDNTTVIEPFFFRDTLFVGMDMVWDSNIVSLTLCNQCLPGWFPLENKIVNHVMSCYKLDVASKVSNWFDASRSCERFGATLVTVERKEELDLLQSELFLRLQEKRDLIYDPKYLLDNSSKVFIGLRRDSKSVAKRFQWELKNPNRYRPLVLNHWLAGKPARGLNHACGVWLYNDIFEDKGRSSPDFTNVSDGRLTFSDYKSSNTEGWADVGCGSEVTKVSLCEACLLLYSRHQDDTRIAPVKKESVNKAVISGDFREFEGNIVSIAAYVTDDGFRRFLKDTNGEFPLFDCGDDAGRARYISYSFVCDSVDHCINRRDESICGSLTCDTCRSGQCVHDLAKCDMVKDCDDGSDEEDCNECRGRRCCDGTCLPAHLFHDGQVDCSACTEYNSKGSDEYSISNEIFKNETCAFICNRDTCIFESQFNDGTLQCTGPEGHLDETIGKLPRASSCYNTQGSLMWAPRCVYFKDRYGAVLGCRDVSHLQDCESFPCQEGYYKCPDTYCIPVHYVLDGKSDCPAGEEERESGNHSCIGHFACWNSKVCLHPDLVCDGHPDCPHKDDELNCDVKCDEGLRCVAGTVTVENKNSFIKQVLVGFGNISYRYFDLSEVDLSSVSFNYTFEFFYQLTCSKCSIKCTIDECTEVITSSKGTYIIDLSYNLIRSIDKDNFPVMWFEDNLRSLNLSFNKRLDSFGNMSLTLLETLDLSHTGLSYFDENCFKEMPSLKYLNLSHTKISTFPVNTFPFSFSLDSLDLRIAPIVQFFENTFNGLIIRSALYADNFGMCCPQVRGSGIPGHMCHASEDAISSCYDLIGVEVQRILLWLVGAVAILGNFTVIVYRLIWDRLNLKIPYCLFVLNLGISDLIMGLYLLMIAGADVYYRGVYVVYDKVWKASDVCKTAGFLATLSIETSTFFILLITVDRFLVLTFPYGQRKFSRTTKIAATVLAWGVGFVLAVMPVLSIFGEESIFFSSAMCTGLPLTNDGVNGWEYSVGVFIILNFVLFLVIAFGQAAIFRSISENRIPMEASSQNALRRAQNIVVAKQLSLVVVSNFLCWFPVGFMGLLSLSGHEISKDVYAWTVVLVLPVNSALNPLLYTIPVLLATWEKLKYRDSRSR